MCIYVGHSFLMKHSWINYFQINKAAFLNNKKIHLHVSVIWSSGTITVMTIDQMVIPDEKRCCQITESYIYMSMVMVFNVTFNHISAISWWSVYWWRKVCFVLYCITYWFSPCNIGLLVPGISRLSDLLQGGIWQESRTLNTRGDLIQRQRWC